MLTGILSRPEILFGVTPKICSVEQNQSPLWLVWKEVLLRQKYPYSHCGDEKKHHLSAFEAIHTVDGSPLSAKHLRVVVYPAIKPSGRMEDPSTAWRQQKANLQ